MRTQELIRHKWMSLCQGLNGEPFVRGHGDGVVVVPVNADGDVLLTCEPAVHSGVPVLVLPAGTVEEGEDPVRTANRELQEEIAFKADRLEVLAELHPLARHAEWSVHVVLACELSPSALEGDELHTIEVEPHPFDEFESLIANGRLQDSTCIAALFLARRFLELDRQV